MPGEANFWRTVGSKNIDKLVEKMNCKDTVIQFQDYQSFRKSQSQITKIGATLH
jgi:hypothetical protein